ncbi:hypothetical protein R9C00_09275 [Flammeovirgaceae bacterium SG7u.111]|nr:hypothetical protein [Flammeovirgaceae bacterium SG7u.132]WPO37640.1 hypothetical protein R9C00_09275 [Flammeovirgaceae bacterium SG7u.111]
MKIMLDWTIHLISTLKNWLAIGLLVVFVWDVPQVNAQRQKAEELYEKAIELTTGVYHLKENQVSINMSYGMFNSVDQALLDTFDINQIKHVDLVFSDFPVDQSFRELNIRRIATLGRMLPGILEQKDIRWQLIRQLDCRSKPEAERLFHGFAFSVNTDEQVIEADYQKNITEVKEAFLSLPPEDRRFLSMGKDTLAFDVLDRNVRNWKNVTIVSDWTASMYPYTTQVLRWHISRLEDSNISNFVFFNDGDNKKNNEKVIGETGGIYAIQSDSFRHVVDLMKYVMDQGSGEDLPENDIEALLFAIDSFPQAQALVLIADNKSAVRDIKLAEQVSKPVHIVLARVFMDDIAYIRSHYLKLAFVTGGSIHTRDRDYVTPEDLENLRQEIIIRRREIKQAKNTRQGN